LNIHLARSVGLYYSRKNALMTYKKLRP